MALSVFPERMNPINPEDVEASLRTLERYVSYMVERVEFALSKNFRTTTELGEAAEETAVSLEEALESLRLINDAVSGLADDVGEMSEALEDKVDKVPGKGLSTNDYTTAEQTKLDGIEAGAEENVIETVKRNGTALPVSGKAVDVTVPVKTSELTNDSGYQTAADVADAYLPLAGGTLTGDTAIQKNVPRINLVTGEKAGVGRARAALVKNANASADSGTHLVDYVWGDGSTANQRVVVRIQSSVSQARDLIRLVNYAAGGSGTTYRLYGDHNPPTIANITGLEARLAAIEDRLTALES